MDAFAYSESDSNQPAFSRRAMISSALAAVGGAAAFGAAAQAADDQPGVRDARRGSLKRYKMKKSINGWAFPYPDRMSLRWHTSEMTSFLHNRTTSDVHLRAGRRPRPGRVG